MRERGFSLVEVLVTMLLIAIGVLGMVGLQARAIQYTQDAVQRNTAAMLANDLVEMMRAKQHQLAAGDPFTVDPGFYKDAGEAFPDEPESCLPLPDAAADQLACWAVTRAAAALPGADDLLQDEFYICQTDQPGLCTGSGDAVEIQLAWRVKSGECLDAEDDTEDAAVCRYRLLTRI